MFSKSSLTRLASDPLSLNWSGIRLCPNLKAEVANSFKMLTAKKEKEKGNYDSTTEKGQLTHLGNGNHSRKSNPFLVPNCIIP